MCLNVLPSPQSPASTETTNRTWPNKLQTCIVGDPCRIKQATQHLINVVDNSEAFARLPSVDPKEATSAAGKTQLRGNGVNVATGVTSGICCHERVPPSSLLPLQPRHSAHRANIAICICPACVFNPLVTEGHPMSKPAAVSAQKRSRVKPAIWDDRKQCQSQPYFGLKFTDRIIVLPVIATSRL